MGLGARWRTPIKPQLEACCDCCFRDLSWVDASLPLHLCLRIFNGSFVYFKLPDQDIDIEDTFLCDFLKLDLSTRVQLHLLSRVGQGWDEVDQAILSYVSGCSGRATRGCAHQRVLG